MRMRSATSFLSLVLLLASCSVAPLREEPTAGELALAAYHEDILRQVADAYREKDFDRVQQLLSNKRDGATAMQRQRFASFDELLLVSLIRRDGFASLGFVSSTKEKDGSPRTEFSMKEPHGVALVLQPKAENKGRILARNAAGTRSTVIIEASVEDWSKDGSRFENRLPRSYVLAKDIEMDAEHPCRLPLPEFSAAPAIFIRRIQVRARLLLAAMQWNGVKAKMNQLKFGPIEFYRFAKGFRNVRRRPLETLVTVSKQVEGYLGHVLVASWFLGRNGKADEKKKAIGILIDLLRAGRQGSESTLLTALGFIVKDAKAHDRDGWLRWWTEQSKG